MVPLPVVLVEVLAFYQAYWLIKRKPWSKSPNGAWDVPRSAVVRCCCGPDSVLLWYRLCAFVYCVSIGLNQLRNLGPHVLKFYTVWNWWCLTTYFGLAALASWRAAAARRRGKAADDADKPVGQFEHALIVLFHINLLTVWIVDALTWFLLVPMLEANPDPEKVKAWQALFYNFTSYNMHGFNAALILGEFALNCIPVYVYQLGWVGAWSGAYGLWGFLHKAIMGTWLYPFLDASQPWAPVAYGGIFVVHWLFLVVVQALARAKQALLPLYAKRGVMDVCCLAVPNKLQ